MATLWCESPMTTEVLNYVRRSTRSAAPSNDGLHRPSEAYPKGDE